MAIPISVVIPVGPRPHHSRWFDVATASVLMQTLPGDELVIVENGTDLGDDWASSLAPTEIRNWKIPWSLGVPVSFNVGVGFAKNEHVLLMGSDDVLIDGCLDVCRKAIEKHDDPLGWYYLGVEYSDGRTQNTPCHASVITKELWKLTGGFPPESAVGACDTMLVSSLLQAKRNGLFKGDFYQVSSKPFYWWRVHPDSETSGGRDKRWGPIINQVRDLLTDIYRPNDLS